MQLNNPIPPRSRARCCADSPRRGEYGSLGSPAGQSDVKIHQNNKDESND